LKKSGADLYQERATRSNPMDVKPGKYSIISGLIMAVISCSHFRDTGDDSNATEKFYSPATDGPGTYMVTVDTTLPSFMPNVKRLELRTPTLASPVALPTIIIEPGFFSVSTDLKDVQNRYATHGFLVVGVTNTAHFNLITTSLEPYKMAILETIRYLVESSKDSNNELFGLIDTNAIGISGHSMGGGGAIMASNDITNDYSRYIESVLCMNPFGRIKGEHIGVPIFMFSSDVDAVINPFMPGVSASPEDVYYSFSTITNSPEKLFANFKGMDHNAVVDKNFLLPTSGNAALFLPSMVSWFKVFLAGETEYQVYLDTTSSEFSAMQSRFIAKGAVPGYYYEK
jgi:hypothetical protein